MGVVDDAGVVGAGGGIGAVEVTDGAADLLHELLVSGACDEHVVGRDARLTRVQELAECDAPRRDLDVGGGVDDDGGFATELERQRGQMLRGRLHDDPADAAVAGVEDVVEPFGEERLRLGDATLDDRDTVGVEVLGHEARQRRGGVGGHF